MLVHAPLFAESREQRDMLMEMSSVKEVFDLARKASIARGRHRLDPDAGIELLRPAPDAQSGPRSFWSRAACAASSSRI